MFFRNSATTRVILDLWSDPLVTEREPSWPRREQDALTHLIVRHSYLRKRVGFVKQREMNSFTTGEDTERWKEGDLVVHFAGCWYKVVTDSADSGWRGIHCVRKNSRCFGRNEVNEKRGNLGLTIFALAMMVEVYKYMIPAYMMRYHFKGYNTNTVSLLLVERDFDCLLSWCPSF